MIRQIVSARRRFERGKASDYFSYDNIKTGDIFVVACRVSGREQDRSNKLKRQVSNLRKHIIDRGGIVVGVVAVVESGWDPMWLAQAAAIAKKHGGKIAVECVNRAIRSSAYHSERDPTAQARTPELEYMKSCLDGVEITSMLDPDASAGEERGYQTRRGQSESGNKGGKPMRKKNRRKKLKPEAIRLQQIGESIAGISRLLNVAESTVRDWLRDASK